MFGYSPARSLLALSALLLCHWDLGWQWSGLLLGAALPAIELVTGHRRQLMTFPWEVYGVLILLCGYWLLALDPIVVVLGCGFTLSRLVFYFWLREPPSGDDHAG